MIKKIIESSWFERIIIITILFAGILVGLETSIYLSSKYGFWLKLADQLVLWIFVVEAFLKILSFGNKPWRYFKNPWNVFDFLIVAVCFLPVGASYIAVLRLVRLLRVIRLVTVIPRLQVLVAGLLKSIPSMFYVMILLALLFYVYGVMGVFLFRENDPGHFGNLGQALVSLFRVVTLEDWTDIMYTAALGSHQYPAQGPIPVGPKPHAFGFLGFFFFGSFVITGSMVMINLFIGVVLTSLTEAQAEQLREKMHLATDEKETQNLKIEQSIQNIEKEIEELRRCFHSKS